MGELVRDAASDEAQRLTRRGFGMLGLAGLLGVGVTALGLAPAAAREAEPGDDRGGHGNDDPPGDDRRRRGGRRSR